MRRIMLVLVCSCLLISGIHYATQFLNKQFLGKDAVGGLDPDELETSVDNYNRLVFADIDNAITVAHYNSGYLYNESDDTGINKDIIEELSRRMGIAFDERVMPRARITSRIEEGSLPMSVSTVITPKSERYSYFIPYFSQRNHVLIHEGVGLSTQDELLERTDLKVGIIRGYTYGENYDKLIEQLKKKRMIVEARDSDSLYKMLKDDWIQVTFDMSSSYLYYFNALDIQDVSIMDWPEGESLIRCITLSKRYFITENAERIKKHINEMKNDGTLFKIYSRYLPEDEAKRMCDF